MTFPHWYCCRLNLSGRLIRSHAVPEPHQQWKLQLVFVFKDAILRRLDLIHSDWGDLRPYLIEYVL